LRFPWYNNSITGIAAAVFKVFDHPLIEDCLGINVWTKPQVGEQKKAVLLWIYGGGKLQIFCNGEYQLTILSGFVSGASDDPSYDGAELAGNGDVIVVSFKFVNLLAKHHGARCSS